MMRASADMGPYFGAFLALLFLAPGCNLEHPGEAPGRGKLYFPTAVAISAQEQGKPAQYLFVANSNFDLAYNAGSVQVFDLEELDEQMAACDPADACTVRVADVLQGDVLIGSFAVGLVVSPSGRRVYVSTRSDSALTYIDVRPEAGEGDILDCGQGSGRRCDGDHVRGAERVASAGGEIRMPPEPVGLIAGPLTDFDAAADGADVYVMVAHRVGAVSLFLDRSGEDGGPELVDVADKLRERLTGIAFDPRTRFAYLTSSDISNAVQAKALDRIGVVPAGQDTFIFDAGPLWLTGVSYDRDTRDLDFAPDSLPGKALVVARVPSSLVVVETTPDRDDVSWTTASVVTEVGSGASRITVGRIGTDDRPYAFVSCFSSRELFVIDTELGEPVAVVRGFSGPFDLALDRWRERLYVADFRSSTVRIVDLRPVVCDADDVDTPCDEAAAGGTGLPCRCLEDREPRITATLGEPSLPTELI